MAPERGTWALSWHGVRTVAVLDLRQRVRSTRWMAALVVWFVVVGAVTWLTWVATDAAFGSSRDYGSTSSQVGPTIAGPAGPTVFGLIVFFVLFLGLLVSPTLSATAINGDRNAGTLATLQVTLLTPAEIAVGKLGASWVAALAFLVVSVPFLILALTAGGTPVLSVVVCLLVLALLLAVVCAIGLGFSALTARTSGSAVLTYVTVAGLSVISPMVFGLTVPAITTAEPVRVWNVPADFDWYAGEPPTCELTTQSMTRTHTERTWWLLAVNPFVIVADAAPGARSGTSGSGFDVLGGIRELVRDARTGPPTEINYCEGRFGTGGADSPVAQREPDRSVVWPWGLAVNLLLGAAGLATAVRRLTIPQRTLPRGTRVA
ncbi:ABC transporter permease [Pengzhenrongella frigida]|uniref:ABC transporter permease n=1 Tax=Pengzhenrongella frigida TaxID=1259133 RepID=A0A4Q5N3N7_9MICO|nr:ABC transporter permease [Cellulomonas sp. HLT2-17]